MNPAGIVFVGWHESEASTRKDFAFYKTNAFGKKLVSTLEIGKDDDIPTGIVADPVHKRYLVCVRKTNQYIEGSYEALSDSLLVYSISYGGQISRLYKQGFEEAGLAPIDIALGAQNTFYVLANKKNTNASVTPVLTKFNYNGSVAWQRTYDTEENSIRAHELLIEPTTEGQAIRFSANNITDVPFPMFIGYTDMGTLLHATSYTTQLNMYVDGVAKQGSDYLFAATQTAGVDKQAAVFKINSSFAHQTTYTVGKAEGDEGYSDIIVYPTGFSCTGLIDTASSLTDNEGGKDILISQFTPSGEVILHETVGSQEDEQIGRCIQHPLKPAHILAGYHKGYGVHESGNAYIAASLYEDVRNLMTGSCEVPRVLFVDNMIVRPFRNSSGLIVTDVLGDISKEQDLINFCIDNNINYISLYRIGFMFDDYFNNHLPEVQNDRAARRTELDNFIQRCHLKNLRVGYIADREDSALTAITSNRLGAFNFNVSGKFNYIQLEHEFWNPSSGDYEFILADNSQYIVNNTTDEHHTKLYDEHKDLLNKINVEKSADGNIWKSMDYVAYFFNRDTLAIENSTNVAPRKAKTTELANLVDAIFTTYYQEYDTVYFGTDFIEPPTSSDPQLIDYRNRLSDLGDGSVHNIIPTFSAEWYNENTNPEDFCGKGREGSYIYDYLGKHLDGYEYDSSYTGIDFNEIESEYINQHNTIYQTLPAGFSNITNVNISAFGWYRYSCVQDKTGFLDKTLNTCPSFSNPFQVFPLSSEEIEDESNSIALYPNPTSGFIAIMGLNDKSADVFLFNQLGSVIGEYKQLTENSEIDISGYPSGIYFIKVIKEKQSSSTFKIIKQ